MYQTTSQFIAATKALKEAFLLSLAVGKPLRIETGRPGCVPCIPSMPYNVILNDHYSLQAVDPHEERPESNRFLARKFCGRSIPVVCNYDPMKRLSALLNEVPYVFLDIQSDNAPSVPESLLARMCYSVTLLLPPDAVVDLLNYIAEGSEFSASNIAALRSATWQVREGASEAFQVRIIKAIRATRPDTEESAACRNSGLTASFGYGVGARANHDLLLVCAAYAVLNGRSEVSEEDLVRLLPAVSGHRIVWAQAKPFAGYGNALTKIAQWAVSV